jgi:hypothetical protein
MAVVGDGREARVGEDKRRDERCVWVIVDVWGYARRV